jgi:PmbA protein
MKNDAIREELRRGLRQARDGGAAGGKMTRSRSASIACEFENGRLKQVGQSDAVHLGVELLRDGRRGSASGNRVDQVDTLVERALTLARVGGIAHFEAWPEAVSIEPVPAFSERTRDLPMETLVERCREMAERLKDYDPDLFVACSAARHVSERMTATSGGVEHHFRKTAWSLGCHAQRTRDSDMLFVGYGRRGCELDAQFDARAIAERALTDLRRAERQAPAPHGRTTAFIPAERLAMFLFPIFMGLNGRNVAKGDSPLAGKLGQRILHEALTVEDRPRTPMTHDAAEADGDGIPTRNRTLIARGELQTYLYDLDSAGLAEAEPTGNDGCAPYRPFVHAGATPSEELLRQIDDGLYVKDLIGYGQSNIINGDFSCNVGLGYRIEKGEIVGRVKNAMISGNLYELLGGHIQVSSDLDDSGCYPSVVAEGLAVKSA